uniref:Phycobiliprotein ApcE n=1 Tax=Helminthora furcellata TaxID=1884666 RepID=A0A1G4NR65_9FLOR|nr:Phycobilisome linker polypeptide [Helminthora furcellata]SCW21153.1 Phycobilisome linker polypeptide [Helminthora furcellata]SCW24013.1 Phycobilisome linker polypeptide [Helminthora furcellata]
MSVKASGGSPVAQPQLYRTAAISTIIQAEQQDRFLQLGELNQLVAFLNSGNKRLDIANTLTQNANFLVAKAAEKIFTGGSAISYLERPQASFIDNTAKNMSTSKMDVDSMSANSKNVEGSNANNAFFNNTDSIPPGFKPINVSKYGTVRMKKSLRDLDWFLRYLTYAIVAGDPNILSVNIRGLRELIDNACSSAAASVAIREMRKIAVLFFKDDQESTELVVQYFNVVIGEFEAPGYTDILRKRESSDLQGLRLPRIYSEAGSTSQKFVMKTALSSNEKNVVIRACYKQVFERDICQGYSISFSNLESQVKNGQLSIKEFVRSLGKSQIYRQQFFEPFVNSRAVELAFRHFLGRGPSSLEEFQKLFSVVSQRGLAGLVDTLINSNEYADYFGEETVPYLRSLGIEPQECRNWGPQINLFNYSAPFRKVPQFITLFSNYNQALPDQHPYGRGNDPLLIQFGAIFLKDTENPNTNPAPFGKDTRRLLIRQGPGIYNQMSNPQIRPKSPGTLGPKIFKMEPILGNRIGDTNVSRETIINACYLRIFGRKIYEEELLIFKPFESKLRDGSISVRDFIRYLAKSSLFRSLYWEKLYVCKAIEYIHNRLLGRPTYGRQEINQYFDIVYKQNYYHMVDAIIDSAEYDESFNQDTVPYERYLTSSALASRSIKRIPALTSVPSKTSRFVQLGSIQESRSTNSIARRINQGVSAVRDQIVVFKLNPKDHSSLETVLRASYRQIFERDLNPFSLGYELIDLERAFLASELTVQQLIEKLGSSSLYTKEFYQPYPNTQVIELGTKHFLGRAPNNQAEIRYYNQILASQGLKAFISSLVNSKEYQAIFGMNIVPYRRFPTLPAANFPNTERLHQKLVKQNDSIVVPSFKPAEGNQ